MRGPSECCLDPANQTGTILFAEDALLARCGQCGREFIRTSMVWDSDCIDPMEMELWWPVEDRSDLLSAERDSFHDRQELVAFIMRHKPYFMRNRKAAGDFRLMD